MINTNKLRGIIAEKNLSQRNIAAELGITPETFYRKMKKGVFDSNEINQMIKILDIHDPVAIFFTDKVMQ